MRIRLRRGELCDDLNRLASGRDASHWGETYSYDNWGNLVATAQMSGLAGNNWSVTANGSNQLWNLTYDAAGEVMVVDGSGNSYAASAAYNAAGRCSNSEVRLSQLRVPL